MSVPQITFGQGIKQDRYSEGCSNNCCGGYAFWAILNDLKQTSDTPESIYNSIVELQNRLPESGHEYSWAFITKSFNLDKRTVMLLPSSIAQYAKTLVSTVKVFYNQNAVLNVFKEILNEEEAQLADIERSLTYINWPEVVAAVRSDGFIHMMVLVLGQHWISVKIDGDSFLFYDPNTGEATYIDNINLGISEKYNIASINQLVIAIK